MPHRIEVCDALDPAVEWPRKAWIAANPPWVSFSGRQSARDLVPTAQRRAPGGWPSLHGAFLERIARETGADQTASVVLLPASIVDLESYAPLRRAVERWVQPIRVRELGETAFPGVVEPAVELTLSPGAGSRGTARWSESPAAIRLGEALAPCPRLAPRSFRDPGIHTGNSAAELILSPESDDYPPIAQGRDLKAYHLGPPSARIVTDLEPRPGRRFRVADPKKYASFPVLLRQTANRPIAALHEPPGYFRNSLLACSHVEGLDAAFIVAVLNGPVAAAWHRALHRDARQRAFPQVKVGHLATQPFPIAQRDDDPRLHDEVAERVRALVHGSTDFAPSVAALEQLVLEAYRLEPASREWVHELTAPA